MFSHLSDFLKERVLQKLIPHGQIKVPKGLSELVPSLEKPVGLAWVVQSLPQVSDWPIEPK